MKRLPWLSVLMPIYNGGAYLRFALDSIALQSDPDIECIAVNGDSTDNTLSILQEYQRVLSIKILKSARQTNWVEKTNLALSYAQGEYACFLHHDDVWFENRAITMKRLTREFPEASLILHPSVFLGRTGKRVGPWKCPLPPYPKLIEPTLMLGRLLVQNFISIVGPVFKRRIALALGGLEESFWYTADWDFWLKIAGTGYSLYYPTPLSGFRIHPSSQTFVGSAALDDFKNQHLTVAQKHLSLWDASDTEREKVKRLSDFSTEVNTTLAGLAHGHNADLRRLLAGLVKLGPKSATQYLMYSRIWERASARALAAAGGY